MKVLISVYSKGGKHLGAKEQEIPDPTGQTKEERDKQLQEIEDMANARYKKLHLPLICRMSFIEPPE